MAAFSDEAMVLAKVYASSMLELAEQVGEGDYLLEELKDLASLIAGNAALARFFSTPTVDAESRERSIEHLFRGRASDLLVNSLQVLNRKERLDLFEAVVEAYRRAHQDLRGRTEVEVITAVPLGDQVRQRLADVVGRFVGREVTLLARVDNSLLGGLVLRVGDRKFDSSVSHGISRIGERLRERTLQEIHGGRAHVEA